MHQLVRVMKMAFATDLQFNVQYVDVNTKVPSVIQTGSRALPFTDLQPALKKTVPSPSGIITANFIHMAQGRYDTGVDYTYDPFGKRLKIVTHGPVTIGTFDGFGLTLPQTPVRNFILAGDTSNNLDGVRTYFAIVAGEESSGNPAGTVSNSFNKCRISGQLDMTGLTQLEFGNMEMDLVGVDISGTDGTSSGISIDMGSNEINGTFNFEQCLMAGQTLLSLDTRLARSERVRLQGLLRCERLNVAREVDLENGAIFGSDWTFSNTQPSGMHFSVFSGSFGGAPIAGSVVSVANNGSAQARFTTSADHGLATGQAVTHTGFSEGTYNVVDAVVVVISATEYDIVAITFVATGTGTLASTIITTLNVDQYTDNNFVANGATLDVNASKVIVGI